MSSRHTPETDAVAEKNIYGVACKVDVDFARKLERERDELQDALEHAQMTIGSIVSPSDKATLELIKVTKERDEAREQIKRQAERIRELEGCTNHACGTPLSVALRERDEAREVARGLAVQEERVEEAQKELSSIHRWIERNHPDGFIDSLSFSQNLERVTDRWYERFDKLERERDEAREEAAQWHNKAQQTTDVRLRDALLERENMWKTLIDIKKQNANLREIADRAIDYLDQSYRNGFEEANELLAELDQLKEGVE